MKKGSLILFFILISFFIKAEESVPMYRIIKDSIEKNIPIGKCRIYGKITSEGMLVQKAKVSTIDHKEYSITDNFGVYSFLIDAKKLKLYAFQIGFREVVTEEYMFKNGHAVHIDFYLREKNSIIIEEKPVIYMYSPTPIKTKISMNLVGDLTFTYPHYSGSWNMIVDGSGILTEASSGKKYPYLFWEGETTGLTFQSSKTNFKGYQINTDSTIQFLESRCKEFGFNNIETTDFITFWGPRITRNSFAKIEFLVDEQFNVISQLTVVPQPDNVRRVYILFQGQQKFDSSLYCTPLEIMPLSRDGFTLLEWGGTEFPAQKSNVN